MLQRLRVPAHGALAIEDSAVGVAAAQGAGLRVLLVRSAYTAADRITLAGGVQERASLLGVGLDQLTAGLVEG